MRFEYAYIYYFFLGMYVAAHAEVKLVDQLCENIHLKQNAFILIFTIHHTQQRALLEIIRLHCICAVDQVSPAALNTDETKFMNQVIAKLPKSIISSHSTATNRADQRRVRDAELSSMSADAAGEEEETEKSDERADVSATDINKGIKIIEVLGQILKNRAGSFERKEVSEMLQETIDLGLRILKFFLDEFRRPAFEEWLTQLLIDAEDALSEEKRKSFSDEDRRKFIERAIQLFAYLVTSSMLSRISGAISSDKLTDAMAQLAQQKDTPAYELINLLVMLFQQGIGEKHGVSPDDIGKLVAKHDKSGNFWAGKTLSYYVQRYLNTHSVKFKDREKVFQHLKFKYLPNKI